MLLAIDTATRIMSLALHDGSQLLAETTWQTTNNHSTELAPAVQDLLRRSQARVEDLSALAVSVGPGSFTGLRIGIALAKGIAGAKGLPLVGVSTLDILAAGQPYFSSNHGLIVVVQAGRGRIIVKTYRWRKGRWNSQLEPQLMDWESLFTRVDGPAYLTGEINDEGQEALAVAQARAIPVELVAPVYRLRRAGFLAEEAWTRIRAVDRAQLDPNQVVPLYIKTENSP